MPNKEEPLPVHIAHPIDAGAEHDASVQKIRDAIDQMPEFIVLPIEHRPPGQGNPVGRLTKISERHQKLLSLIVVVILPQTPELQSPLYLIRLGHSLHGWCGHNAKLVLVPSSDPKPPHSLVYDYEDGKLSVKEYPASGDIQPVISALKEYLTQAKDINDIPM
jgi:hypothetical protein